MARNRTTATKVQRLMMLSQFQVTDGKLCFGPGHRFAKAKLGKPVKAASVKVNGDRFDVKRIAYFIVKGRWTRGNIYLLDASAGFTKKNLWAKSDARYLDDNRKQPKRRVKIRPDKPKRRRIHKGRADATHGIDLGDGSRWVTAMPTLDEQEAIVDLPGSSFPTAERELELQRLVDAANAQCHHTETLEEYLARGGTIKRS